MVEQTMRLSRDPFTICRRNRCGAKSTYRRVVKCRGQNVGEKKPEKFVIYGKDELQGLRQPLLREEEK